MEEIINKIVEIDNRAKAIINEQREKERNIDDSIDNEFKRIKKDIDATYRAEIEKENQKYESMLNEKKKEIDSNVRAQLENVGEHYREQERNIIDNIINNIKNK